MWGPTHPKPMLLGHQAHFSELLSLLKEMPDKADSKDLWTQRPAKKRHLLSWLPPLANCEGNLCRNFQQTSTISAQPPVSRPGSWPSSSEPPRSPAGRARRVTCYSAGAPHGSCRPRTLNLPLKAVSAAIMQGWGKRKNTAGPGELYGLTSWQEHHREGSEKQAGLKRQRHPLWGLQDVKLSTGGEFGRNPQRRSLSRDRERGPISKLQRAFKIQEKVSLREKRPIMGLLPSDVTTGRESFLPKQL